MCSGPARADRVDVHHLGIEALDVMPPACVDAAYSNFGPLNCVDDLERAAQVDCAAPSARRPADRVGHRTGVPVGDRAVRVSR